MRSFAIGIASVAVMVSSPVFAAGTITQDTVDFSFSTSTGVAPRSVSVRHTDTPVDSATNKNLQYDGVYQLNIQGSYTTSLTDNGKTLNFVKTNRTINFEGTNYTIPGVSVPIEVSTAQAVPPVDGAPTGIGLGFNSFLSIVGKNHVAIYGFPANYEEDREGPGKNGFIGAYPIAETIIDFYINTASSYGDSLSNLNDLGTFYGERIKTSDLLLTDPHNLLAGDYYPGEPSPVYVGSGQDTFPGGFPGYGVGFLQLSLPTPTIDPPTPTNPGSGAVPEPATWAMMVLGFGMVGFGMRSRRKQSVRVTYA